MPRLCTAEVSAAAPAGPAGRGGSVAGLPPGKAAPAAAESREFLKKIHLVPLSCIAWALNKELSTNGVKARVY